MLTIFELVTSSLRVYAVSGGGWMATIVVFGLLLVTLAVDIVSPFQFAWCRTDGAWSG